jgi:leucyl-tRNA synthetase
VEVVVPLVLMVAPLAPHIAEELWERLGHTESLVYESFPEADPALLVEDLVEIPVQFNGKVRAHVMVAPDADAPTTEAVVRADERVVALLEGKTVRKVVVVAGRLVNFVVQ